MLTSGMTYELIEKNILTPRPIVRHKRYGCVFQASWWLDVYKGDPHHQDLMVIDKGKILGRLVFLKQRNGLGMRCGLLPAWAHLGGPVLARGLSEGRKVQVLHDLVRRLPKNMSYKFACDSYAPNAGLVRAAFLRAGFTHRRIETYCRAPDDGDMLARLTKKQRKHLRQAEKDVEICSLNGTQFADLYEANINAGGKKAFLPFHYISDIIDGGAAQIPPQVRVFAARKKQDDGRLSAPEIAIACTWDTDRYYFWLLTRPLTREANGCHPDTVKLLLTRAMEHAQSLGLLFDSDGAGSEGIARLYRDLMKLPDVEWRDVFERDTAVYKAFKALRAFLSCR